MSITGQESGRLFAALSDFPRPRMYRLGGWVCLLVALAHTAATLVAVHLVRNGNLGDFSPLKLLQYVSGHVVEWRVACLLAAFATLSMVVFTVSMREVVERRAQPLLTAAIVFVAIAAANDLNSQFSMMVLFYDLGLQSHGHGAFNHTTTVQLAWALMNQALTQSILIANTLYSVAECFLVAALFISRNMPKWLAWLGVPIVFVSFNVSILAFIGSLQWALVLILTSTIAFVLWVTILGLTLRLQGREKGQDLDVTLSGT